MQTHTDLQTRGVQSAETAVTVRCTGHVRTELGEGQMEYTFVGDTLRAFLRAFFEEYDVEEMLIAETEAEAMTEGWAPAFGENYAKNPEGERSRRYARVLVDGTFNEHLDGLDTELDDESRVTLIYPLMYCC